MPLLDVYPKVFAILAPNERRSFIALSTMSLILGVVEAGGVLSVVPFVAIAADPLLVERSELLGRLFSFTGFETSQQFLIFLGISSFVLLVSAIAFRAMTFALLTVFARRQSARLSTQLMRKYVQQDYVWFLDKHSAELNKTILSEVEQVVDGSVVSAIHLIAHTAVSLGLILLLVIADPLAALVAGGFLSFVYGLVFFGFRRRLERLVAARIAANRERFEVVQETVGGIKEVKLLNLEEWFLARYRRAADRMAGVRIWIKLLSDLPSHVLEGLVFGGMILFVLWTLLSRNEGLTASLPLLSLFAVAGVRLFPVLQQLYGAVATLGTNRPALDAIFDDLIHLAMCRAQRQPM